MVAIIASLTIPFITKLADRLTTKPKATPETNQETQRSQIQKRPRSRFVSIFASKYFDVVMSGLNIPLVLYLLYSYGS